MKRIVFVLAALSSAALAQARFTPVPIAPPALPAAIPLPAPAGASRGSEAWLMFGPGNPVVRNVAQPTLTPVLPEAGTATGAAVIVAPGGGFLMLSMETEGLALARRLAARGIAAFVLKYRLEQTPAGNAAFLATMMKRFGSARRTDVATSRHPEAAGDARAALSLVRTRAAEWGVDPARVGLIGFSAGAMTGLEVVQTAPAAERPAFLGYVYGPQRIDAVPAGAPPLFDAIAFDDPLFDVTGFPIATAWTKAGGKVELHAYQRGGHGFGGLGAKGTTTTLLLDQFIAWLDMQGFLTRKDAE